MSIYSGFPTRAQEASYMRAVYSMNCLLTSKILQQLKQTLELDTTEYEGGSLNDHLSIRGASGDTATFCRYFVKLFKKIYKMDKEKHLEP